MTDWGDDIGLPPGDVVTWAEYARDLDAAASADPLAYARAAAHEEHTHKRALAKARRYACKPAARIHDPVPRHPETEPVWHREQRLDNRKARRRNERAGRRAASAERKRRAEFEKRAREAHENEVYRRKKAMHFAKANTKWRYLKPRAPGVGMTPLRPMTREQFMSARMAIGDEWGCRAAIASLPAEAQLRLVAYAQELQEDHTTNRYGSPYASRAMRKTVSTYCAILYRSRASWREGYTYVTTGLGREGIAAVIGPAPESGRLYSVAALSHVETGSLAVLERLGLLHRQQMPGGDVPECDRGPSGYAFNHYCIPEHIAPADDQWRESACRPNPSADRDVLEHVCPWLALTDGEKLSLSIARQKARAAALDAMNRADDVADSETSPELDSSPALLLGAPLAGPDPPPDR